jgi:hypothetical protein
MRQAVALKLHRCIDVISGPSDTKVAFIKATFNAGDKIAL